MPSRVIASVANYFIPMKTKTPSLSLLIAAGLLLSSVTASATTIYGLTTVNGTQYDLSPFADLSEANLSYANLTNAELSEVVLVHADLSYAILIGANLDHAILTYTPDSTIITDLTHADLTGANLLYAQLSNANLTNATLTGATLTGTYLDNANLTGATVSYSNWTDFSTNSGASGLGSYLYNTSLINYVGNGIIPEPSTYGLIGIGALGVAFAARRRKLKTA